MLHVYTRHYADCDHAKTGLEEARSIASGEESFLLEKHPRRQDSNDIKKST
jgi:hypothetical protein